MENQIAKLKYEDCYKIIDKLLDAKAPSWRLNAISWFDYEDVKQKIRIHLVKKWDQWDQTRPLAPWVNTVIVRQTINEIKNHYKNYSRPCLECPHGEGGEFCRINESGFQGEPCDLYAKWVKGRKRAYNVKLPLNIDYHWSEIEKNSDCGGDVEQEVEKFNLKMKDYLTPAQFNLYKLLFIDKYTDDEIAIFLKLKITEKNKKRGYRKIQYLRRDFMLIAKDILLKNEGEKTDRAD